MPTLTITKTYADSQVLSEADLDNIKDSIETFINVTKLDDSNLQDNGISASKLTTAARALLVPTGTILDFAGASAPTGYLLCYGQEVSQATYADLFTVISTVWNTGGEVAGNFRLPDLRDRTSIGKGDMGGVSANRITSFTTETLGATGGAETTAAHTHVIDHGHSVTDPGHTHTLGSFGVSGGGAKPNSPIASAASGDTDSAVTGLTVVNHAGNSGSTGTGTHGVVQPSASVNKIIKT